MTEQQPSPKKLDPLSRFLEDVTNSLKRLPQLLSVRWGLLLLFLSSLALFLMVFLIAVPRAVLSITPRETAVSITANVLLEAGGAASMREDPQPRFLLPLLPVRVEVRQSLSFDQISRKFTGNNATVRLIITNESRETYSLRPRTRFQNQAGMIFRIKDVVKVPAGTPLVPGTAEALASADPEDLYGQIVGERGNVPALLKWEMPGLPEEERSLLYARNPAAATGGTTSFTRVLKEEDLILAEKILQRHLADAAEVLLEERIAGMRQETGHDIVILPFEELKREELFNVKLPMEFLGHEMESVPVEGSMALTALAYDRTELLKSLEGDVRDHVERGKVIIEESLTENALQVYVISYDDNLAWVKTTVEMTARERYRLDPVTPEGIAFGEKVREAVKGKRKADVVKIVQNFPEVGRVSIRLWPPWKGGLPVLPSQIVVEESS